MNLVAQCIGITAFCLLGGLFMAYITQSPEQKYVRNKANGCHVVEQKDTDNKIYCGKACYAAAIINVYQCSNGSTYQ